MINMFCPRYTFEKDGKICTLHIKECRPDDECEYACGVDEKKSRARLFVEGELINVYLNSDFDPAGTESFLTLICVPDIQRPQWRL